MSDTVTKLLNPEVRTLLLGIKDPEEIQVYPLTYYDQKEIGMKVATYIQSLSTAEDEPKSELDYITKLVQVLEDNIPLLISKCTDKTKKAFMSSVSSGQLMEFITIIMEVNFLNPIKKGTRLFVEMGTVYGTNQSLPPSANTTDTDSGILPHPTLMED